MMGCSCGKCSSCCARIITLQGGGSSLPIALLNLEYKYGLRVSFVADNSMFPLGPHPTDTYQFEVREVAVPALAWVIVQPFSTNDQFIHLFPNAGTFEVRLTIRDSAGNTEDYVMRETVSRVLEVNNPDGETNTYIPLLSTALNYVAGEPTDPTPIGTGIGGRTATETWSVKVYGYIDEDDNVAIARSYTHVQFAVGAMARFGDGRLRLQRDTSLKGSGWGNVAIVKDSGSSLSALDQAAVDVPLITTIAHVGDIWIVNEINGDNEAPNPVNEATALEISSFMNGIVTIDHVRCTSRAINTARNAALGVAGVGSKVESRNCLFESIGDDNGARVIRGGGLVDFGSLVISNTPSVAPLDAVIRQGGWEFTRTTILVSSNYRAIEARGDGAMVLRGCYISNKGADANKSTIYGKFVSPAQYDNWEIVNCMIIHDGAGSLAIDDGSAGVWANARFVGNIVNGDIDPAIMPVTTTRDIGGNELW